MNLFFWLLFQYYKWSFHRPLNKSIDLQMFDLFLSMFRSGAGGACDCGDECKIWFIFNKLGNLSRTFFYEGVMNSKGFCKSHSKTIDPALQQGPPDELIKCCEIILSNLLFRLLQHFRTLFSMTSICIFCLFADSRFKSTYQLKN